MDYSFHLKLRENNSRDLIGDDVKDLDDSADRISKKHSILPGKIVPASRWIILNKLKQGLRVNWRNGKQFLLLYLFVIITQLGRLAATSTTDKLFSPQMGNCFFTVFNYFS